MVRQLPQLRREEGRVVKGFGTEHARSLLHGATTLLRRQLLDSAVQELAAVSEAAREHALITAVLPARVIVVRGKRSQPEGWNPRLAKMARVGGACRELGQQRNARRHGGGHFPRSFEDGALELAGARFSDATVFANPHL